MHDRAVRRTDARDGRAVEVQIARGEAARLRRSATDEQQVTPVAVDEVRATSELREQRASTSRLDVVSASLLGGGFLMLSVVGLVDLRHASGYDIAIMISVATSAYQNER
ncbi:MAG: hypothetical protein HC813_02460 [Planctomycetes bacterium]|nr:hypothetical protein [Planctomycetota bacterium]